MPDQAREMARNGDGVAELVYCASRRRHGPSPSNYRHRQYPYRPRACVQNPIDAL